MEEMYLELLLSTTSTERGAPNLEFVLQQMHAALVANDSVANSPPWYEGGLQKRQLLAGQARSTPGRSPGGQKQRVLWEEELAVEVLPFSEYAAAPSLLEGDGFAA